MSLLTLPCLSGHVTGGVNGIYESLYLCCHVIGGVYGVYLYCHVTGGV